ncbi:Uncharacterised protein [Streptococcus pneumoniae]|nr:Uncharacterised protein [Streptococcus pneumoniae]
MDNGIGIRQSFRHRMVVSHNDIYSHRLGQFNSLVTSYPIVHRHNQGNSFLLDKIFINTSIWTIAISKTIRQVNTALSTKLFQAFLHNRSRSHAIRIVVSINENIFPFFNGLTNPSHCLIHIMEQIRIVQVLQGRF